LKDKALFLLKKIIVAVVYSQVVSHHLLVIRLMNGSVWDHWSQYPGWEVTLFDVVACGQH
jgi:hypothetical protein